MIDTTKIGLNQIIKEHWKYFNDFIGYNIFPNSKEKKPTSVAENKKYRNKALYDMIGATLYNDLPKIIKSNLTYLRDVVRGHKDLFCLTKPVSEWKKKLEVIKKKKQENEELLNNLGPGTSIAIQDGIKNKIEFYSRRIQRIEKNIVSAESFNNKEKKRFKQKTSVQVWQCISGKKGDKSKKWICRKKTFTLKDLLGYDFFYDGKDWNSHKLCKALDIGICPYCNRQYIYTVQKQGEDSFLATAQLDHFLPKDRYPLLSFSFFNLVPSCYCCNHTKGDNARKTIYPYEEKFGNDGTFALVDIENGKKIADLDTSQDLGVKIKARGKLKDKVIASDEVFQLTPLYNKHQTEISDFVERYKYFSGIKKNEAIDLKLIEPNKDAEDIILGKPIVLRERTYLFQKLKEDLLDELNSALKKEIR